MVYIPSAYVRILTPLLCYFISIIFVHILERIYVNCESISYIVREFFLTGSSISVHDVVMNSPVYTAPFTHNRLQPGSIDDKSTLDAISREGRGCVPG
jgi:hypothetical protein